MAKLVKPLLVVAAIAVNVIPGVGQVLSAAMISSITMAGIAAGLGMAAQVLGLGPKSPQTNQATRNRLYATIDPATPRKLVFGRTAFATDIRYEEWTGANQEYLHRIICLASHKINGVENIYFDDKLAWTAAGGVQGEFVGYLDCTVRTEGTPDNTVAISAKWGATRRMTGLAYIYLRYKVTGNTQKKESPFASSIPQRVTIEGEGAPVYDPRFDSTQGGDGTMRADDQTTWAYTYGGEPVGRNPANQVLSYLLGYRIKNPADDTWKLAVGRGIPPERIDFESFITAANACDEPVALAAGGTEPRYRTDGIFSESDDPRQVIDQFETSMNAKLRDAGGRFSLTVISNDLATPRFDFDDSDVLGEFRWTPTQDVQRTFNEVRGRFTNPAPEALYQLVDFPRYREPPTDGIERVHTLDLPLVQSGNQAQRIAKQQFARSKYPGRWEGNLGHRGWAVQLGDVVTLTFSALGWEEKLFRIVEHGIRFDGVCPVVLQEEHPDIYLWDADERPVVAPVARTPYDASKSVLMQLLAAGEIDYADGDTVEDLQPAEPGADVTGAHTSLDTENVNGRDSAVLVGQVDSAATAIASQGEAIDDIIVDIADLVEVYGDTVSAATSAAAAAAAQTAAETARNQSQTARDAAQAAETNAIAQASAASGSATTAAGHASTASTQASAAAGSATAAAASATTATTQAGAASTSASNAASSATSAAGSASSAATSATTAASAGAGAILSASASLPNSFDPDDRFFVTTTGDPATALTPTATDGGTIQAVAGYGKTYRSVASVGTKGVFHRGVVRIVPGRKYELTAIMRMFADATNGAVYQYANLYAFLMDETYAYVSVHGPPTPVSGYDSGDANFRAAEGWKTFKGLFSTDYEITNFPTAVFYRFGVLANFTAGQGGAEPNAQPEWSIIDVRDVTEREAAASSASAAASSASSAAASQTAAGSSASAAASSATTAATQAGAAASSASTAATSASTASTQATNAANSATAAASSAVSAQSVANRLLPTKPGVFADFTSNYYYGNPPDTSPAVTYIFPTATSVAVAGEGNVFQYAGFAGDLLLTRGGLPVGTNRTFRMDIRTRVSVDGAFTNLTYFGFFVYDASWAFVGTVGFANVITHNAADGWQDGNLSTTSTAILASYPTAAYIRAGADSGRKQTAPSTWSGATWQFSVLGIQDTTSEAAAAGSATAAATSASAASTSAAGAAASATSATTSANTATTQASGASSSASSASSSAAAASASASAAATSAVLSASISLGAFTTNPQFTAWSNPASTPDGWYVGDGPTPTRITGPSGMGYAMRAAAGAAQDCYQYQPVGALLSPSGYYVIEVDLVLEVGTLRGGGIYWAGGSMGVVLPFRTLKSEGTVAGDGTVGRTYRFRELVQATSSAPSSSNFFVMTHWGGIEGYVAANQIQFQRALIRAATQMEIDAGVALPALQATVSTQAGAITDLQGRATAYWQVTGGVTAGNGSSFFISARAAGSYGGSATSAVAIGANEFHVYNAAAGGNFSKALSVVGGRVLVYADLEVGGAILVGARRIPVALQSFGITAYDGEAVDYGGSLGNIPTLVPDFSGFPALSAGETYVFRAESHTASGFTARVKKATAGTPTLQTSAAGTAPGSGPTYQCQKPTAADAYNGVYRFNVTGNIRRVYHADPGPPEPEPAYYEGSITFQTWFKPAGTSTWLEGPQFTIYPAESPSTATVAYNRTIDVPYGTALGQDATNTEFGVSIDSSSFPAYDTLTGLTVSYYSNSGVTESTATPSNIPLLPIRVLPNNA